jgi:hypothetical protein
MELFFKCLFDLIVNTFKVTALTLVLDDTLKPKWGRGIFDPRLLLRPHRPSAARLHLGPQLGGAGRGRPGAFRRVGRAPLLDRALPAEERLPKGRVPHAARTGGGGPEARQILVFRPDLAPCRWSIRELVPHRAGLQSGTGGAGRKLPGLQSGTGGNKYWIGTPTSSAKSR